MSRVLLALAALAACGDNADPPGEIDSGSRLGVIHYRLSDGTTVPARDVFFDRERDEDCVITTFSSGERHCMPSSAGGTVAFTEDSCTRAIGSERTGRPPPPYFIRYYTMSGVALPSKLYRAGAPVAAPSLTWQLSDGYCLGPYPLDPSRSYYAVEEAVAADELVEIRATETVSDGRLSMEIDTSDDGWRAPGALTDELLGLPCELESLANAGRARCIPTSLPPVSYYADGTCTVPLVPGERAVHRDLASGCVAIAERGVEPREPFAGTIYQQLGEECVAVPDPGEPLFLATSTTELGTLTRQPDAGARIRSIALPSLPRHDLLLRDTSLDADCALGDGACTPVSSTSLRTYFRDAQCTTTVDVTFVPVGDCQPPARFADGHRIGSPYPDVLYELTTGDRCDAYTPPVRFAVHTVDADVVKDRVTAERLPDGSD